MKSIPLLSIGLAVTLLLSACATQPTAVPPPPPIASKPKPKLEAPNLAAVNGIVRAVPDAQTLVVRAGQKEIRIRLAGIIAPEAHEQYGEAARRYLAHLVLGETVETRSAQHTPARVGQVVWQARDLALEQLNAGFARYDAASAQTLSSAEREQYQDAEAKARSGGYGLWKDASPN